VTLEEGGFTSTAPAKPTVLSTSSVQATSFDVTLPADPDDGGVPITKRVFSAMPEADYNAGNYANAIYLNNFSAQETRTIDAGVYGAIGSSQTHILRWKAPWTLLRPCDRHSGRAIQCPELHHTAELHRRTFYCR